MERKVPGVVVENPMLPEVDAMVRYVVVPWLKLLMTPMPRLPRVVEANQWVILLGSLTPAPLAQSVRMSWGEEVEMICNAA